MITIKKVLGSNIVIKKETVGSVSSDILVMPDTDKNFYKSVCEVLEVGPGEILPNGEREPMCGIKPGMKLIVYPGYGEKLEDNIYLIDITMVEGIYED